MKEDSIERRSFLRRLLAAGGALLVGTPGMLLTSCGKDDPANPGRPDEPDDPDVPETTIPDRPGMTVKGCVTCGGKGVAGVAVSDGCEVALTDSGGIYYLPSKKETGFVFVSVPGNYEVPATGCLPRFYRELSGGEATERHDFTLSETDNRNHALLVLADIHLSDRTDDLSQLRKGFFPDTRALIDSCEAAGSKVYALTLGDESWDEFWYSQSFALPESMNELKKIGCTLFNSMGNHDNDPYGTDDWQASAAYRRLLGPTYYSFNLGNVHYVVLDSIRYLNKGGAPGTVGDRSYENFVTEQQLAWLEKDLAALVDRSAPLVVAMHSPVYAKPVSLDAAGNPVQSLSLKNGKALLACLAGFANVKIITGHAHINYVSEISEAVTEYNVGAVCASWWWTGAEGYAGNHICKDGSPGGYGVIESDGTDLKWTYKGIGCDKAYQFRAYDLNQVHITAARYAPNSTDVMLSEFAGEYAVENKNNEVLINIWSYDSKGSVEVTENGVKLPVVRVAARDPLHIISYEAKRLDNRASVGSTVASCLTTHLFKVRASAPDTPLEIRVTDRYGRLYEEKMMRPKVFGYTMI